MTATSVLFIQGGGEGAHREDALLARSLRKALGSGYDVCYPQMPDEGNPSAQSWQPRISAELSRMRGTALLVAHSVGGAIVLKCLAESAIDQPIAGLFLLAAPALDGDQWKFDDLKLPDDTTEKLARIPRIFVYHCRDDEVVPYAHLALHAKLFPNATTRSFERGGHQFGNDLACVADDIRA